MNDRFPKITQTIIKKLDFMALPNLGYLLVGLAVLGFIAKTTGTFPLERYMFHPQLVLQGEWWRLVTFPVTEAPQGMLWMFFYCLYILYIMNTMESLWGVVPLTIYTFFAYICVLAGSFATGLVGPVWLYVIENLSLAFGTLFPDIELQIFGIFPVKAKWLAILAGVMIIVFQFIPGSSYKKTYLIIAMLPYLLFFGPVLINEARMRRQTKLRRQRFDQDMWK